MRPPVAAAAAALALSCAGASTQPLSLSATPPGEPPEEYVPTGEIQTRGESTSFNAWRVVGPRVNMTRRPDGTWAGTLVGRNYILKPGADGRLTAPGADLHFLRWGKELAVLGNLGDLKIRLRFRPGPGLPNPGGKVCRFNGNLIDCRVEEARAQPGVRLRGEAADLDQPVMPQLGLALIAITYLSPVDG
ncbi:conserved hypothetical protein [Anaeromyxobacter dehalogenans 2CP-1]|uniref:Uncharacterized protein n=1 Tax=Anaeromyxobacter dehalogenans (strain ATCC BAA-258 / DSM 21875 / 2CP-1) TaxID=455488 RepID=B8JDU4_ANAD2|nr:hypothetical protein [Anaeromyxobacter dehalogenans]ACL64189.1 conserved hypothetical protein [Anaeromyxobacter dehalogenans 2CP-1]